MAGIAPARHGGRHLAAALLLALPLAACGSDTPPPPPPVSATAGPRLVLRPVQIADWQDVSAEIATVDQAQVVARISGILAERTVNAGDMVRKGQVIGRITDSQLAPQAGAAAARADAARAHAAEAAAELTRVEFLYKNGVYARARYDQAKAGADAAAAEASAARAQRVAVGAVAGQGVVVAPANGRVLRADVPAGAPVAPGMVIATITAGAAIVRLDLPESLVGPVHRGSRVRLGGSAGTGTVSKVYPMVSAGQVAADVTMPGLDTALIGRRVAARVEAGSRAALIVPKAFVSTRFGIDYVRMITPGGAVSVPVQTAPGDDPETVEILSGASAGDTLAGAATR